MVLHVKGIEVKISMFAIRCKKEDIENVILFFYIFSRFATFKKLFNNKVYVQKVLGFFPKAFFQGKISQTATSQRLGRALWGATGSQATMGPKGAARTYLGVGKLQLGIVHIWEVSTWENTCGKLPFGKRSLGKYPTSF